MKSCYSLLLMLFFVFSCACAQDAQAPKIVEEGIPELVLVFTKTEGYRHKSIEKGVKTLRELGRENGFIVLQTETASDFNPENLKNYSLVVFLSTTQDVLNSTQEKAFQNYIRNGGLTLK